MPFSRDENGGGTESDGTRSSTFCSHCYRNGKFTLPDINVEQMKARVREKIMEKKFPGFIAWLFTRNIHKLERWRE